jgi:excisionase family DNA binding protein
MALISIIVSQIECGLKYEFVGWPLAPVPNDSWLTPEQCANHLQISRETLLRMVRSRTIPFVRLPGPGRIYRFQRVTIERWAEARTLDRANKRP